MEDRLQADEPPSARAPWWRLACLRPRSLSEPDHGPEPGAVSREERRDVLSPLPSLALRRSATAGSGRLSSGTGQRPSSARPSRTMGSLTAWQMLAADVQRDMEEAAAAGVGGTDSRRGSRADSMRDGPLGRGSNRRSQLEQPGGSSAGDKPPASSTPGQQHEAQQSSGSAPSQPAAGSSGSSGSGSSGSSSGSGSSGSEALAPPGSGELNE